jgi:Protein of unknown function (DUF2970)
MASPGMARSGSILQTVKAVAWAFLGIRKNSDYQRDLGRLNPFHVVAVALVAVALFVGGLIALVHWVAG